jgi:hypothetical protein
MGPALLDTWRSLPVKNSVIRRYFAPDALAESFKPNAFGALASSGRQTRRGHVTGWLGWKCRNNSRYQWLSLTACVDRKPGKKLPGGGTAGQDHYAVRYEVTCSYLCCLERLQGRSCQQLFLRVVHAGTRKSYRRRGHARAVWRRLSELADDLGAIALVEATPETEGVWASMGLVRAPAGSDIECGGIL